MRAHRNRLILPKRECHGKIIFWYFDDTLDAYRMSKSYTTSRCCGCGRANANKFR